MNLLFTQITKDTRCSPNYSLYPFKEQITMDTLFHLKPNHPLYPFKEQITINTRFFTKSSNVPIERNTMNTQRFDK